MLPIKEEKLFKKKFKVVSTFQPTGDQPQAIESLAEGIKDGLTAQVLLGATGTGKTFTIAKVIEKIQLPTLVIAHNKTLAAQLAAEFKSFSKSSSDKIAMPSCWAFVSLEPAFSPAIT